ncbi:lung adenoma susceptibility protein 2 [Alligator mississippiensis]|uniref:Lung adenoma susceptibility protein 2 n=1 Tax=Alligator mississippiensis TaxID=8496 RepID=A0A151MWT4_ALLMI|nr:lung adenoma susceptibility protein 2 [Alligator mississippiensis]KYO28918.1 lung adenoma susceptibility protein 2 [Alligator mississippiensis]
MACSIKKGGFYSPESTITSLLASCNLDSNNSCSSSSIHYKEKLYNSASQALEAYIEDFDLSLVSPEVSTGKICISQSTPKCIKSSEYCSKQKYGLEDLNQHVKLDSKASSFRRQRFCDLDLVSLTTDDLLAFPPDGSLPSIRSTPFGLELQSSERKKKSLGKSRFCPYYGMSSFKIERDFEDNGSIGNQHPPTDLGKKKRNVYKSLKYDSISEGKEEDFPSEQHFNSVSVKNYPRWLTSQKSDLNVSGISSIPDFKYPVWLKNHNLLSDSDDQSFNQTHSIQTHSIRSDPSILQTHQNLKKSHFMDKPDSSHNCCEQNSYLDLVVDKIAGKCDCDSPNTCFQPGSILSSQSKQPFRDDQLELLILKARRTLESSAEDLASIMKNDGSPCTVDILEAERSWENVPIAFKPPVPVQCEEEENALQSPKANIVNEFLEDCLNNANQENTFSGGNHHGPVEALKLMLFNLQAVHESFKQTETTERKEELFKLSEEAVSELKLNDNDVIPVTKSLQKALHHLSRLKSLVDDNSSKDQDNDHQGDKKKEN